MTRAAAEDLHLWQSWVDGGHQPDDLEPLLHKLDPLIHSQVSVYAGQVNIPPDALQAKAEELTMHSLRTFDPRKETQLSTHVFWGLRGLNRYVASYQNPARIPQHQTHKIQELLAARDTLTSELGRPPTDYALARKMNWSPTQVHKLQEGLKRKALDPNLFPTGDPRSYQPSRLAEVMDLLPPELDTKQKFVFESTYGVGGSPQLTSTQMAKRLKISPASLSRLKKGIANTIQKYLDQK